MTIKSLMNNYYDWLKSETIVTSVKNNYFEITAPFLDNANDYIQIYAKINGDKVTLTDDGYYLSILEAYGIKVEKNRLRLIESICKSNGVNLKGYEITSTFSIMSESSYQYNIHKMIQTILRIDDMHYTSSSRVKSYFLDDVIEFLDKSNIGYSQDLTVYGKTGLPHTYELHFQRSKSNNERFAKVINNLSKQNMTNTLFMWSDTQEVRNKFSELLVFANDEKTIDKEALTGFNNYGVKVIEWSKRNDFISDLM